MAGGLERFPDGHQHRGLPGARHPDHQVETPSRGGHRAGRLHLSGGEAPGEPGLLGHGGRVDHRWWQRGGALAVGHPFGDVGDRGFGGQRRGGGPGPVAGGGLADQRDRLGVPDYGVDDPVELAGGVPVELGCRHADDVGAGERLALREWSVGADQRVHHGGALLGGEVSERLALAILDDPE
ncbi:MAG: hypothetical protein ACRD08_10925, partial [Acidimicrobiales bacterium]